MIEGNSVKSSMRLRAKGTPLFLFLVVILSLTTMLSGCNRHQDKAEKRAHKIEQSKNAVEIDDNKPLNFSIIDTANYYIGNVGDQTYIFKIDKLFKTKFSGRYYVVNDKPIATCQKFEVKYQNKKYIFTSDGKSTAIKFDISVDTASIIGDFTTSITQTDKQGIAFVKYRVPAYKEYSSPRYAVDCPSDYLEIETQTDVVYGKAKGYWTSLPIDEDKVGKAFFKGIGKTAYEKNLNLTLDLYLPKDTLVKKRPLLVFFHGGAFYMGDKGCETMVKWCEHFAQTGYVVASVNYRMGFTLSKKSIQKSGYEAIQDAHAALRFLVAHAEEYGIDPNYIFVGGTSAGSITALGMAFMTNATRPPFVFENGFDKKLGNIESSGNNCHNTFHIKAIANMWGAVYDLDELNGHHIPVISFHGTEDNLVPFDQGFPFSNIKSKLGEKLFDMMYGSQAIHKRLDSLHVRNEFHPIAGCSHAPYQDKKGHPNDCYYFIQGKMQKFFYVELARVKGIAHEKSSPQVYYCKQDDVTAINWKVDGGFILKTEEGKVKVLWRSDSRKRKVTASGLRENGMAFTTSD